MKRFLTYVAVVGATLGGLFLLWQLRLVAGVFLLSLLVSATVRPIISRLTARGLPKAAAMILTYLSIVLAAGLTFYYFSGPLVRELDLLIDRLTVIYEILYPAWDQGSPFQQAVAEQLPPPQRLYDLVASEEGQLLAQKLFVLTRSFISLLSGLILILVLSVYWSTDQAHFERLWLSLLAPAQRSRGRKIWHALETGMGRYIRYESVLSLMAFLLLVLVYAATGINYPILLALLGALAWWIPILGFAFTIVPAFLAGMATSLTLAVSITLYTMLVLLVLEFVVQPILFHRRRAYSPILAILLIIPLSQLYGLIGLMVAPPLAVAIQILLATLFRRRSLDVDAVYPTAQVRELKQRLAALQEPDAPTRPELENMMNRLQSLLGKTEQTLDELPVSLLAASTDGEASDAGKNQTAGE